MAIVDTSKHSNQLKLSFDPFDPDVPASHFFPGGKRQELLDQLVESCCYSSDMAVVTGPLGSGKSTLALWLAHSLDDDFVAVSVRATLFMSAEQLLESVCEELELDYGDSATADELIVRLDQYIESLNARSVTLQLLVDDAHELGEEGLQVILDLLEHQSDASRLGEDGLKVVLFGESMLLNSIRQLVPTAGHTLALEPLTAKEAVDYVAFKLATAGHDGRLPLDIDTLTVIESRARGIPGAISALVKEELGGAFSRRPSMPDLGFLERHLVAASVLFGALILALFFALGNNDGNRAGDPVADNGSAAPVPAATGQRRVQVPLPVPAADPQTTSQAVASAPGQPATDQGAGQAASAVADAREVAAGGGQVARSAAASASLADVDQVATAAARPDAASLPDGESAAQLVTASPFEQNLRDAERLLLARSPESYTLQLLGSHSEDSVKEFIASNSAPTELNYFESSYQDRPWFVVVHGNFPDRGTAREAIDRLPPSLRELQPWARNLSDIQTEIRKHQ